MKILIVEDEKDILELLAKELEMWGYETIMLSGTENVLDEFERTAPDMVMLDIVLPQYNGLHWCHKIRERSKIPIMFISSRAEDVDVVQAMHFGGDDYITKPFNIQVVRAKVQALLRRSYDFAADDFCLTYGDVRLSVSRARLYYEDRSIELTRTELLILEDLFRDKGRVSSREKLMNSCWQGDDFIDDNTLAVNIARLRKKLSGIGLDGFILTKKGIGYCLKNEKA